MKINKKISFGLLLVSTLMMGFYLQNQIGKKNEVDKFFANVDVKSKEIIEENYPKDLIIKVDKGQVNINQKLPYCLVLDKKTNEGVVFDSAENPNIKSFETQPKNFKCKPLVLIGKDYVATKQKDAETKINKIPTEVTVELNQKMLLENKSKYLPMIEVQGRRLYTFLPVILMIFILPWIMLTNFWYSLVVYLLAKLFKLTNHPEIGNRYWIALFFGSILAIVNTLISLTLYPQISFPFSGSIIIGSASIIYLKYLSRSPQGSDQSQKPEAK